MTTNEGPTYVNESAIREQFLETLQKVSGKETLQLTEEFEARLTRWVTQLVSAAQRRGRLMTDIQYTDWCTRRALFPGDRVRYIGPTREEMTQSNEVVLRPHGQVGTITSVEQEAEGRVITFHPDQAESATFVDLQVREHTPGWLMLERIVEV